MIIVIKKNQVKYWKSIAAKMRSGIMNGTEIKK